jgi:hypothetical protein
MGQSFGKAYEQEEGVNTAPVALLMKSHTLTAPRAADRARPPSSSGARMAAASGLSYEMQSPCNGAFLQRLNVI